jgi:TRAP transporter TAXI family solute receptor
VGLACLLGGSFSFAKEKSVKIPEMMTWTSYEVGTSLYMQVGYVATTLFEKYGIKIRLIPAGSDIPRVYPVRLKDAEVAFHGLGAYFMQEGLEDYSSMEWGPQPIRALYFGKHPGLPLIVRGDSKIYNVADLKGKKVAAFPTRSLTLMCEVHLIFGGLTWDDVVKVKVPAYSTAVRMVMEKGIDATILNPTAPLAREMESMPYGLRYIPMPHKDKEGWARVKKVAPWLGPSKATIGAGVSPEKPLETLSYAYPTAVAYDFLPEEKAYIISKLLVESYSDYAKKNKSLKAFWEPDLCLEIFDSFPLPMHKGTIRYFKEIGKWTPERKAKNNERLKHQAKLKKIWSVTVAEALEKKIKSKKFPEFWTKKRASIVD